MTTTTQETFSVASVVAAIAAVVSLFASPLLAVVLAGVATVAGAIGFFKAASPKTRGGLISLAALTISGLAFVGALIRAIF